MHKNDTIVLEMGMTFERLLNMIRETTVLANPQVVEDLHTFVIKAHDPNREEVADLPSTPWVVLKEMIHPNKYVDIGHQRFYRGFAVMAGRGKHLHAMTREEEDEFLAKDGVACFLPIINGNIYAIVHGVPLVRSIPKATFARPDAPHDAVRITIEGPEHLWVDKNSASLLIFQSLVSAGYRDVTHRSSDFPSNAYHEAFRDPVGLVQQLEFSDRAARLAGSPQHALRSRKIIIDQLPNVDENGEAKTTLTYKDGKQVGYGGGPFWDRQPKETMGG